MEKICEMKLDYDNKIDKNLREPGDDIYTPIDLILKGFAKVVHLWYFIQLNR